MKKIIFLTGTRADFGHLKSLIDICEKSDLYEVFIFATWQHKKIKLEKFHYINTIDEIKKYGYKNVFEDKNKYDINETMDIILSEIIQSFSNKVKKIKPDLIIIFSDRVEQLAGAIVGFLNNILTVQIEAGDISGTIDESIRHAITKLCHAHFVSNQIAKQRVIQMGENENNIFRIGTPGLDVIYKKNLPDLESVKKRYGIFFKNYSILSFHPVVTEQNQIVKQANVLIDVILKSKLNYIIIYPNRDHGFQLILEAYKRVQYYQKMKFYSHLKFMDYLILLKNADFIIGNSSSGIIEAPCFAVPTINIGTRQNNRSSNSNIINCNINKKDILSAIKTVSNCEIEKTNEFGEGKSAELFLKILNSEKFWKIKKQKQFNQIKISNGKN